ncbi:MAG: acyl-CoA dehydrogenase family protein [Dehalococcoidia bacterium]|nr:acyl-CoA dehydrogenase family protein [Dehalococcoidia bacterium]MDP7469537.1 acyl-CoA dehydrogenase family protein [Dehalococcoidia bacterium]
MSFGLTEAQEMFRRTVRDFAQRELGPGVKERDRLGHLPKGVLKRMAAMGLLGLNAPEQYGGQTVEWVTVGIANEEVGAVDINLSLPMTLLSALWTAFDLAPQEAQEEWIPRVVRGEALFCLASTEPSVGSDVANLSCRAFPEGDYYILNGEKTSVSLGMQADLGIVFANTDVAKGARGVTAFLVPLDLKGVSRSRIPDMGCKAIGRGSIFLDNVHVPASYRLGDEGRGFYLVMGQFDVLRPLVGLMCLGSAQASLNEAVNYAKQRMAFGKPIARFEGVSFKIAEAATMIDAARYLCYHTLAKKDRGERHNRESAMCKWLGPAIAVEVIHNCLLIHGQIGYSEDCSLEQRLRDVIGLEIGDGTAEIMKIIVAREMMGREYLPY